VEVASITLQTLYWLGIVNVHDLGGRLRFPLGDPGIDPRLELDIGFAVFKLESAVARSVS
jgi:hypothetical protein